MILAIITLLFFALAFFYPEIVKRYSYGLLLLLWAIIVLFESYSKKSFWLFVVSALVSVIVLRIALFDIFTGIASGYKNMFQLAIPIIFVIIAFVAIYWIAKIVSNKIKFKKK